MLAPPGQYEIASTIHFHLAPLRRYKILKFLFVNAGCRFFVLLKAVFSRLSSRQKLLRPLQGDAGAAEETYFFQQFRMKDI